jgi:hypothetical protein
MKIVSLITKTHGTRGRVPPLDADDRDLVVPANPVEQVDQLTRISEE